MKKNMRSYICFLLTFSLCILMLKHDDFSSQKLDNSNIVSNNNFTKIIYLTFDDGPSENTSKILSILDKYEISATFFVVGPAYQLKNNLLKVKLEAWEQMLVVH